MGEEVPNGADVAVVGAPAHKVGRGLAAVRDQVEEDVGAATFDLGQQLSFGFQFSIGHRGHHK